MTIYSVFHTVLQIGRFAWHEALHFIAPARNISITRTWNEIYDLPNGEFVDAHIGSSAC
jgi:hypothetical protein